MAERITEETKDGKKILWDSKSEIGIEYAEGNDRFTTLLCLADAVWAKENPQENPVKLQRDIAVFIGKIGHVSNNDEFPPGASIAVEIDKRRKFYAEFGIEVSKFGSPVRPKADGTPGNP